MKIEDFTKNDLDKYRGYQVKMRRIANTMSKEQFRLFLIDYYVKNKDTEEIKIDMKVINIIKAYNSDSLWPIDTGLSLLSIIFSQIVDNKISALMLVGIGFIIALSAWRKYTQKQMIKSHLEEIGGLDILKRDRLI